MSEYGAVRWQSTSALADAYVAVSDALRSGRVCLGDVLEAWRYAECLESELEARGVIGESGEEVAAVSGESEDRERIMAEISTMLGLLDVEKLRLVWRLLRKVKVRDGVSVAAALRER